MLLLSSLIFVATAGCATAGGGKDDKSLEETELDVQFKKNGKLVVTGKDGKKIHPKKVSRNDPINTKKILGIRHYTLIVRENECTIDFCDDVGCYSYVVSPGPCPPGLFD